MVRVPAPDEEDAKRIHRERESLVQERLRIENAIEALLFTQGIRKRPSRRRRSAIFLSCTPEMDARCHALASAGLWHEHEDALTGLLPPREWPRWRGFSWWQFTKAATWSNGVSNSIQSAIVSRRTLRS
jgi:hypothetical protein